MLTRARWAVATVFFANGAVIASWVPHIPAVKSRHALSDGQLGAVLLAMAAGSVLSLPFAGWLVGRFGSRAMTMLASLALCLALPRPVISDNVLALSLSLAVLGATNGTLDVSMNAHALSVERRYQRPIMSSFHVLQSWRRGGRGARRNCHVARRQGYRPRRDRRRGRRRRRERRLELSASGPDAR